VRSIACPQRRSATIFPCRCAPFLAGQNSRRPPLSALLRPFGCGSIAPGPSIAIKAARGGFERQTGDHIMATIGTFTLDRGFLKGQIKTLNLSADVSMEPVESQKEGAPAYRVYAGAVELGAAWAKTAKESGRAYHQVRIDDPSFPAPIFANLIEEDSGSFALIWNRPKATRRGEGNHGSQSG
jgi:uncharacterized protein (DUF736 family)